jgi:hypothetical protein
MENGSRRRANFFKNIWLCMWWTQKKIKSKKKAPSSSEEDEEEADQASTSSFEDEEMIWHIGKVMRMICKINLMGVPLQVEDVFFNIDRCWGLVLKCFGLRTRQHKNRLMVNILRPSKHYFSKDIMIFRRRSWRTHLHDNSIC